MRPLWKIITTACIPLFTISKGIALAAPISVYFASDLDANLWRVDVTTGISSMIGSTGVVMSDIALSPEGKLFGVSSNTLYEISPATGTATLIGNLQLPGPSAASALTFDGNGDLFLADGGNSHLYTVDTTTGTATDIGAIGFTSAGDLATDSTGGFFMTANSINPEQFFLVSIDPITGDGTFIGFHTERFNAIDFFNNDLIGITPDGSVMSIDTATGSAALISTTSPQVRATGAAAGSIVPEPTAIVLLSTGLIVLALRRRH